MAIPFISAYQNKKSCTMVTVAYDFIFYLLDHMSMIYAEE